MLVSVLAMAHAGQSLPPQIVHVAGHAALSPDGSRLAVLSPVVYRLLVLLSSHPPTTVIRYHEAAVAMWPDGAYPADIEAQVRWHAGILNRVLAHLGWQPDTVRAVYGIGLRFVPRSQ